MKESLRILVPNFYYVYVHYVVWMHFWSLSYTLNSEYGTRYDRGSTTWLYTVGQPIWIAHVCCTTMHAAVVSQSKPQHLVLFKPAAKSTSWSGVCDFGLCCHDCRSTNTRSSYKSCTTWNCGIIVDYKLWWFRCCSCACRYYRHRYYSYRSTNNLRACFWNSQVWTLSTWLYFYGWWVMCSWYNFYALM